MKMQVVSVLDVAAQAYGRPAFCAALGAATRSFVDEVNRAPTPGNDNVLFSHPEDFQLFHIGEFDDFNGQLVPIAPVLLLHGSAAKQL
ncbi:MAG: nonstructural protein [Microviridae sp.]|nr:MAG: nonstructural protein [Microviridae sp.]